MEHKLARACEDSTLIEELLDKLSEEGLQSDERFVESFIHHRLNKGQGPMKINQELRQRGVDQNLIDQYFESGSVDWLSLAEEARAKKFGDKVPEDYQNKAKQSRFLYSRGFSSDVINQLLK